MKYSAGFGTQFRRQIDSDWGYGGGYIDGGDMKELFGKITASLEQSSPDRTAELIEFINRNIKPPEPLTAEAVHIRAMYIVSDQVNSCGGIFPADEHALLRELLIDSPVLVGHRKDSLPIARNFHAEEVVRDGENWIKVYFYWLKEADRAEDLKRNIDGGIYKEGSISFVFALPECTLCGKDIRTCGHCPFQEYEYRGGKETAHFNYRKIIRVLETSLVYRGAVHDTSITGLLHFDPTVREEAGIPAKLSIPPVIRIDSLDHLGSGKYAVCPAYESLRVIVSKEGGDVRIKAEFEELFGESLDSIIRGLSQTEGDWRAEGRLIGYRGKQRRSVEETIAIIERKESSVTRLEIRLVDLIEREGELLADRPYDERHNTLKAISGLAKSMIIPMYPADQEHLRETIQKYGTKAGVEIVSLANGERLFYSEPGRFTMTVTGREAKGTGFHYTLKAYTNEIAGEIETSLYLNREFEIGECLEVTAEGVQARDNKTLLLHPKMIDRYRTYQAPDTIRLGTTETVKLNTVAILGIESDAFLRIKTNDSCECFRIKNFDKSLFQMGRSFRIEAVNRELPDEAESLYDFRLESIKRIRNGMLCKGVESEILTVRPALLNGKEIRLMSLISGKWDGPGV